MTEKFQSLLTQRIEDNHISPKAQARKTYRALWSALDRTWPELVSERPNLPGYAELPRTPGDQRLFIDSGTLHMIAADRERFIHVMRTAALPAAPSTHRVAAGPKLRNLLWDTLQDYIANSNTLEK